MNSSLQALLEHARELINDNQFVKLSLGARKDKNAELKSISAKWLELKKGPVLSFVLRYQSKDITRNFPLEEGLNWAVAQLEESFDQLSLFGLAYEEHYTQMQGKPRLKRTAVQASRSADTQHDHSKKRLISPDQVYLKELGVVSAQGQVKSTMQDKFRQINKFVEIMEPILRAASLRPDFRIVDMGSGKGYLTFALADYLQSRSPQCRVTGVELRPHLVEFCNELARKSGLEHLDFIASKIEDLQFDALDVLIALHACDTATDDALYEGLRAGARLIVCAPCCHKQVRRDMQSQGPLAQIAKFGILEERQAELLTDGIRALILEAYGYKTKVFEFISTEHTPKNVLIVASLDSSLSKPHAKPVESLWAELQQIKKIHGLGRHYLEAKLLESASDLC